MSRCRRSTGPATSSSRRRPTWQGRGPGGRRVRAGAELGLTARQPGRQQLCRAAAAAALAPPPDHLQLGGRGGAVLLQLPQLPLLLLRNQSNRVGRRARMARGSAGLQGRACRQPSGPSRSPAAAHACSRPSAGPPKTRACFCACSASTRRSRFGMSLLVSVSWLRSRSGGVLPVSKLVSELGQVWVWDTAAVPLGSVSWLQGRKHRSGALRRPAPLPGAGQAHLPAGPPTFPAPQGSLYPGLSLTPAGLPLPRALPHARTHRSAMGCSERSWCRRRAAPAIFSLVCSMRSGIWWISVSC